MDDNAYTRPQETRQTAGETRLRFAAFPATRVRKSGARGVGSTDLTRRALPARWKSERHLACYRVRPIFVPLEEAILQTLKLGTNVTIFLLFFGISLLDAVRSNDWPRALLWLALGVVFLRADALKPQA
jgi:hypothetical protein